MGPVSPIAVPSLLLRSFSQLHLRFSLMGGYKCVHCSAPIHKESDREPASHPASITHRLRSSLLSPSWSDLQGAVDDGAITGLRMRRSSAVRRPTPCHFSSLSSLLVHSSLLKK